ncbi:hydrolase TatD [candidate division WOR-1 bacterium RIFOXYB2_FULL_42_35]|uniref:Hydrolase TatD n=1 Tax=candidate division WOR-1 bacterium RIFOXYC2_FULL_41_25 TaxID=1802586 RepID=A0A1F4TR92_UNCSA|nr:MAG: hydrolase TatD [candidate division WOR-1 bacterium RIFOXYB2_FULL_42_35]OGC24528.1 MAG: hydrolase TatD [candidate division WOR-1 bacterium RIFOXYA2_FULL_41_14]OGC34573.1 MAG: hydrolase TatD [candidate division WOR-1 bacterium RIFOXYC2_FULL_41_25]OGC43727.1 MAG: hydrolase TatD [candidate division WOR-1 bacterium RIFOXYD2_FULL_41_8]
MFIDTHAHLTFPEFNDDLPQVIQRAKEAKLEAIVNIALDEEAIKQSLKISEQYPSYVFMAAGCHPHEAKDWTIEYETLLRQLAQDKKIVALGEMGLDYHYNLSPKEQQQEVFRQSLRLAQELDLPAIIHSREASRDTMLIIHEENKGNLKGVLHCFGSEMVLAKEALDLGLMISFTGTVTFKKAQPVRDVVREIPLESLMIETDCPFLAPQAFRGQRNEPAYVVEVAKQIAEVKDLTLEEVAETTTQNAKDFFNI